jgi:hypothetical protein
MTNTQTPTVRTELRGSVRAQTPAKPLGCMNNPSKEPNVDSLIEKLKSPLPVCPYDRRSPDYYTTPDDAPCKVCGGLPDGPDLCRGADTRVMDEAAAELTRLTRLTAEVERLTEEAARPDELMLQVHDALEAARDKMRGAVEPDEVKLYEQVNSALYAVRSRPAKPLNTTNAAQAQRIADLEGALELAEGRIAMLMSAVLERLRATLNATPKEV